MGCGGGVMGVGGFAREGGRCSGGGWVGGKVGV